MQSTAQLESAKRLAQLEKDLNKQLIHQDWEALYKIINMHQDSADESLIQNAITKMINQIILNYRAGQLGYEKFEEIFKNSLDNKNPFYKIAVDYLLLQSKTKSINTYLSFEIYEFRRRAYRSIKNKELANESLAMALSFIKKHYETQAFPEDIFDWLIFVVKDEFSNDQNIKSIKEIIFESARTVNDKQRIIYLAKLDFLPALFHLAEHHAKERGIFNKSPHVRRALSTYAKYVIESQMQDVKNDPNINIAKEFINKYASDAKHDYHSYAKVLQTISALVVPKNIKTDTFIMEYLQKQKDAVNFSLHYSEGVSYTLKMIRDEWLAKENLSRLDAKPSLGNQTLYYGDRRFKESMLLVEKENSQEYIPVSVFLASIKIPSQKSHSAATDFAPNLPGHSLNKK